MAEKVGRIEGDLPSCTPTLHKLNIGKGGTFGKLDGGPK